MKSLLNKYQVDNVPFYFKPFYWVYGYGLGCLAYVLFTIGRSTLKVNFVGKEKLQAHQNYIYCFWHEHLLGFYTEFRDLKDFDMINHPVWFMKPVHVLSRMYGMKKIFYGSTGNKGLEAAKQLEHSLKQGKNTFMCPDGPSGPAYKLYPGVMHLSKNTQTPILPMRFRYSKSIQLPGWDRKRLPLPFSRLEIEFGTPILIEADQWDVQKAILLRSMA